jgi:hypothetical protein
MSTRLPGSALALRPLPSELFDMKGSSALLDNLSLIVLRDVPGCLIALDVMSGKAVRSTKRKEPSKRRSPQKRSGTALLEPSWPASMSTPTESSQHNVPIRGNPPAQFPAKS